MRSATTASFEARTASTRRSSGVMASEAKVNLTLVVYNLFMSKKTLSAVHMNSLSGKSAGAMRLHVYKPAVTHTLHIFTHTDAHPTSTRSAPL